MRRKKYCVIFGEQKNYKSFEIDFLTRKERKRGGLELERSLVKTTMSRKWGHGRVQPNASR